MNLNEIKAIAKKREVNSGRLNKAGLIRAIQQAEGNAACFGTGSGAVCGQPHCLWREECA